jgi:hypothetical protein
MNKKDHDQQTIENGVLGEDTASLDAVFNPDRLRLSQNFENEIGVKKVLNNVPVRKPDPQSFIRVHPDHAYRLETAVLELKAERETYLVHPSLVPELSGELTPKILFTAIDRQGVLFLWAVRLPDSNGRLDPWNSSALQAAEAATERWVRVVSNRNLGAYDLYVATAPFAEPEWPNLTFEELLKIAFKDRFIGSLDHPVVQKLRGLK